MNDEPAWQDHSSGAILQYDFQPPDHWTEERIAAEQLAMAARIDAAAPGPSAPGWLRLAARLPPGLRAALAAELRAGNRLAGIGSGGWPGEGSIVVNLAERLSAAVGQGLPPGVSWRKVDDPHHAREELSQKSGAVECLIVS